MAPRFRPFAVAAALGLTTVAATPIADAFCGFYVSDAGKQLFNNATTVVLMREGTRTVLSMQNNYQGPAENFAMVVPVPVVLQKENVKTLSSDVFDKIDKFTAPRLVEYWEQDPCAPQMHRPQTRPRSRLGSRSVLVSDRQIVVFGVKIEAQFTVGEYDVVILSARDSAGLERWLRRGNYKIPAGSEPLLRPYVQAGSKFFVAKVNAKKVKFKNGQAMLSPLRFHYDSETFSLPVRLGLLNSAGTQDLIVHILAHSRYEAANYPNVAIPTNLEVTDAVRNDFGSFYAALFDRTVARQPGAVTTEYAWDFNTKCDPCVDSTFGPLEVLALGADVLESTQVTPPTSIPAGPQKVPSPSPAPPPLPVFNLGSLVLTRLHVRYGKDGLGNDLVFRTAPPMAGGQEFLGDNDQIEPGASEFGSNSFQARYAIRYAWTGPMGCTSPVRGIWGEPPRGVTRETAKAAQQLAFAKRGGFDLATMIARDHDETKIDNGLLPKWTATDASAPAPEPSTDKPPPPVDTTRPAPSASSAARPPPAPPAGGCAGCRVGEPNRPAVPAGAGIVAAMGIAMTRMLRRKKTR